MQWTSAIEWPRVRHSKDRRIKGSLWKGDTLRVSGGQKGPAVVTVCQRQINGFSSFFVIVDISKV